MKILISAAEASSDTHAAEALRRIVARERAAGREVAVAGVGGPKLREAGLRAILPAEDFLAMGFVEVLGKIPKLRRQLDAIEAWAAREKPDVAVLCDYPEFHFRLAIRLRRLGIRTVCYIPPKVWVWRKQRLAFLAANYDRVLSILPFEEKVYAGSGVDFRYVGNPLMDELPLAVTRAQARERFGLPDDRRTLLLMVGSRPSEFRYHLRPMLEAAYRVQAALGERMTVLVPLPLTADREAFVRRFEAERAQIPEAARRDRDGRDPIDFEVSQGDAWWAMRAADAGLIKSGTSSLEAALLDCPHVVIYRAHPVSELVFKHVVRYRRAISLTNLVYADAVAADPDTRLVPELILGDFTVARMAEETRKLFRPGDAARQREGFARIRGRLGAASPSDTVAEEVLAIARGERDGSRPGGAA